MSGNDQVLETGDLPVGIPLVEERLEVTRRVVETGGGVRVRKTVHEEQVSIVEPLRVDGVEVTRKTIGRDVAGPVAIRYEGDVTIFPVVMERLVTTKQLVLVEELHVRRTTRADQVSQDITLRHERAIVERQLPGAADWREEPSLQTTDEP